MRGIPGELKVIISVQLYTSLKGLGTREIAETVKALGRWCVFSSVLACHHLLEKKTGTTYNEAGLVGFKPWSGGPVASGSVMKKGTPRRGRSYLVPSRRPGERQKRVDPQYSLPGHVPKGPVPSVAPHGKGSTTSQQKVSNT